MPEFKTSRRVQVPAEIAYQVAANVRFYPRFLPLLTEARILGKPQVEGNLTQFKAQLGVNYAKYNINETFVSDVICDADKLTVTSSSNEAPFKEMKTVWRITPAGDESDVAIEITYSMRSLVVQLAVITAMGIATQKVMAAFERRALVVHRQSEMS